MDEKLETASQAVKLTLDTLKSDPAFSFAFEDGAEPLTTVHGVSLLTLKNQALLSYLHNSVVVLLAQVERAATSGADEDEEETELEKARNNAIRNTVTQRIVLEKGIKGLESKIAYQVEKSIRAYAKSKAAASTTKEYSNHSKDDGDDGEDNRASDEDNDNEEEEEQDDGDLLLFKPNPKMLLNGGTKDSKAIPASSSKSRSKHIKEDDESPKSKEKYQPPKIAATSLSGPSSSSKRHHNRKNALMEDYLESTSVAPVSEPSIGTTITGGGRGLSTARDRRKEKEIKDYEETNYTRLSSITRKQQEKEKKRRSQRDGGTGGDSFFGEDWGFSSRSNVESATAKRRKDGSVWERAKKRRHR